ncbi:FHA domain-containing protein [Agromyces sp. G08B096]|uniref:FHA domain-containing protein n=1 Tax=Agromyces sp. G08B096 TaxID=3156399 RepID=A0AAU7WAV6_9MICO
MDASDFIIPPPGLIPDAPAAPPPTTERAAPRRVERSLPSFTPVAPPAAAPPTAPTPAADEDAQAPTAGHPPAPHLTQTPAESGARLAWRLTAPGLDLVVDRRVVLGRAPAIERAGQVGRTIAIDDPARTVSKTHAVIEPSGGGLEVTDLHSTNGVRIEWPDGSWLDVENGATARIDGPADLLLGEYRIAVAGTTASTV